MRLYWLVIVSLCFGFVTIVSGQSDNECSALVQTALEATQVACEGIQPGQACYGHVDVSALPYPQITDFQFEIIGDLEDIANIEFLETGAADINQGIWGIARIDVEAFIPGTSEREIVTLLMFGDTNISNRFESDTLFGTITSNGNVNVRLAPTTSAVVMGVVANADIVGVVGRNADNSWLRIRTDELQGWVAQNFVDFDGDIERSDVIANLPDVTGQGRGTFFGPMQAFYLRSSTEVPACRELPQNGLIIQTQDGEGQVNLLINEVSITFDSTILLQTPAQVGASSLVVSTLEGEARVESNNVAQFAQAGEAVSVELDETGMATDTPSNPMPFDADAVAAIPISILPRPVDVPESYEPSASAPVILDVTISDTEDSFRKNVDIAFTDLEGDVVRLQLTSVQSGEVRVIILDTEIDVPSDEQQAGFILERETLCEFGTRVDVLFQTILIDAEGNSSNTVEYRLRCGS